MIFKRKFFIIQNIIFYYSSRYHHADLPLISSLLNGFLDFLRFIFNVLFRIFLYYSREPIPFNIPSIFTSYRHNHPLPKKFRCTNDVINKVNYSV